MIQRLVSLYSLVILLLSVCSFAQSARVPAVPLITHDPYFSIWSMNDNLTDGPTRHWTGAPQPLTGLVRLDGRTFRWMGAWPRSIPAMKQTSLEIAPTHTIYRFEQQGVRVESSVLSPVLPFALNVLCRP